MTFRELNQEAMRRVGWTEQQIAAATNFADRETGFPDGLHKELVIGEAEKEEMIGHLIGRYHEIQDRLKNLTLEEKETFMATLLAQNQKRAGNN